MRGVFILAAMGLGAYAAHRAGYLPQLGPVLAQLGQLGPVRGLIRSEVDDRRAPSPANPATWTQPDEEQAERSAAIRNASGGEVVPILGDDEVITLNKYEAALRDHWRLVSPWARENVGWAAAIMAVENAGIDPAISGDRGTSHGVYQVKTATAETVARAGFNQLEPTTATLKTLEGGIYFGTHEMQRLSEIPGKGSSREWVLAAYNGGAGWEVMPAKYQADRRRYVERVKRKFVQLYGPGATS